MATIWDSGGPRPASRELCAWFDRQEQAPARAKTFRHRPGHAVQGGGRLGTSWTAFMLDREGKAVDIPVTALSSLAAVALVRTRYPGWVLVAVR